MEALDTNSLIYISEFVYKSPCTQRRQHLQDLVCMSIISKYMHRIISTRVEHVRPKCDFKIDTKLCCGKVNIKRLMYLRCDAHFMKCNFLIRKRKYGRTIKKYCTKSCYYHDHCGTHNYIVERKQINRNYEQTRQYYCKLEREHKTKVIFAYHIEGNGDHTYISMLNGEIYDIVSDINHPAYYYMQHRASSDLTHLSANRAI